MDISVILPTYKPEDYLITCLDSLRQQIGDSVRFEVIIVLNGPFEGYQNMIENYIEKFHFSNATLLLAEKSGVSMARNLGIDHAKGAYVFFMDDDDVITKGCLNTLFTYAAPDRLTCCNNGDFEDDEASYTSNYIGKLFTSEPCTVRHST